MQTQMHIASYASDDLYWMHFAYQQACLAEQQGEVPVGAVIVKEGKLIAAAYNQPIAACDPSAHAEIQALRHAGQQLNNYRLPGCELYVTLEPCMMCAGAILHARLARVIYAAPDPKTGVAGSVFNAFELSSLNHHTKIIGGVMAQECSDLLKNFFYRQRQKG
jgi:tRNA(adenine34) deaminase